MNLNKFHHNQVMHDWKSVFLSTLAKVPVVTTACVAAGVSRVLAYNERRDNKAFEAAWNDAIEDGIDNAEAEAYRRGVTGFTEPLTYQGQISYETEKYIDADGNDKHRFALDPDGLRIPITVRKHSDPMLQFFLKGRRRTVYGDKQELTGPGGGALTLVDETQKSARLAALLALAQQRKEQGLETTDEDLSDLA